jgi:formylmethanofuran dehydrogenase subunit E
MLDKLLKLFRKDDTPPKYHSKRCIFCGEIVEDNTGWTTEMGFMCVNCYKKCYDCY